jgi:hypothetical protein
LTLARRALLLACIALVLFALPATAEAADQKLQDLLSAMQSAQGGQRWKDIGTLHLVLTVTHDGQQLHEERWEDVATGRYLDRTTWPSFDRIAGFDGITPWLQSRSGIAYEVGDQDAGLIAVDEAFRVARAWWFPDRHPATIALSGQQTEDGRTYDVLDITPEGGRRFEAWIDSVTHLLDRTIESQAEDHVVTRYSDYRPVAGILLPFTIRTGDGGDPATDDVAIVQMVAVNEATPDALYTLPPLPPADIDLPAGRDSIDVPFRLTATNRILVPILVNGKLRVEAEFDSGGSLILRPGAVAELGLSANGQTKQSGGGEGSTLAINGRVDTVRLGDATVHNLAFHSFASAPGAPQALVGQEILQRFVVHFDFDRRVMTLTKPAAFAYTGSGTIIPFDIQDNQPEIKGSVDGIAGKFAIDTGDSGSLLLIAPFARRYGLVARYHADLPYSGKAVGATRGVWARQRVASFSFDGPDGRPAAEVHGPITRISLQKSGFDAHPYVSGNIGLGILKQFNLTFDYARRQLILERNHLYGQKDVFNRAGLTLSRQDDHWSIGTIYPDGPASTGDLHSGDTVLRIDGFAADQLDDEALWLKMRGPVGTKLRLTIGSESGEREVTLLLRELL